MCSMKPYTIKLKVKTIVPDPDLVQDAWLVPSGVANLAPTASKTASILEHAEKIRTILGAHKVVQQESWTTFIVSPIEKR